MKPNPHATTNLTTNPGRAQGPNPALPPYERILLGMDQHVEHLRIVRQFDGAGPPPPPRGYPGGDLEHFLTKQLAQVQQVFADFQT